MRFGSRNAEVGAKLAALREAARVTQAAMAAAMGVSQPQISRLEAGGEGFGLSDHLAYLSHLSTPDAGRLSRLLDTDWRHLPPPPLDHPDIDRLLAAEGALDRLRTFLAAPDTPRAVAGQAELLSRRIQGFGEFLRNLRHTVAWVGDIGVGKTTAACRQAGLVVEPNRPEDLRGVLLDTGGGRVTLCEVSVASGSTYGIAVEPLPDEEVYRIAADFSRALWTLRTHAGDAAPLVDYRPAEEIERALRNMAGLMRPPRRKGAPPDSDPAVTLLETFATPDEFKAELAARLALWRRTGRQATYDGTDDAAGRVWLKETFAAINNGRHPDFSLPARMTVTVPFAVFGGASYDLDMVDTRGVDGSAVRPDIVARLNDRRTVSVLCSRFNSAPDVTLQNLLQHLIETEVDPGLRNRVILLVLARAGEALAMRDDSGQGAEDVEDGYDIKRGHVEDALGKIGAAGVEVQFFDSAADDARALTADLIRKAKMLREAQADALGTSIAAVDAMLDNVAKAQALAVLETVNHDLSVYAERRAALGGQAHVVQRRLIAALRTYHPRQIWAATRRAGAYWNFDVYQHLGAGAAEAAKKRAEGAVAGLQELLQNRLADPDMVNAHAFVGQLLADLEGWESEFVEAVRHHAIAIYRPKLKADDALWSAVEGMYGYGRQDYRGEVAAKVEAWFLDQDELADKLERRLQRAWRQTFLKPLRKAAGQITEDS